MIILNYIVPFIILVITVVVVHEFGHYIVARLFNVDIVEFSVGFGPKVYSYKSKKTNTAWSLRSIPLGGFVKMAGEDEDSTVNHPTATDSPDTIPEDKKNWFAYKKIWQKFLIVLAGPAANYILTIVLYTFIFLANGMNVIDPIVNGFTANSPAAKAGIMKGDRIIAVDNHKISHYNDLKKEMLLLKRDIVTITVARKDQIMQFQVAPTEVEENNSLKEKYKSKLIGIILPNSYHVKLNAWQAFKNSVIESYQISITSLRAIGQMISQQRSIREISGPIKIAQYSGHASSMGFMAYIMMMAFFSVSLGLMNLLPMPMLDGGHLFLYLCEVIIRRPLPAVIHRYVPVVGMAFFGLLTAFAIVNDLLSIFYK